MASAKKILKVSGLFLLGIIFLVLFSASSFVKRYLLENDLELLGRELAIENISINYFSMTVEIDEFEMKEQNGSDQFIFFKKLLVNIEPWELFSKRFYIEELKLDGLELHIEQEGVSFNFDDLLALGESVDSIDQEEEKDSEPWNFGLANLKVTDAKTRYESDLNPLVELEGINIDLPLFIDTAKSFETFVDLGIASGGSLKAHNVIDMYNSSYHVKLNAEEVNLKMIESYITAVMDVKAVKGYANADLAFMGNWENTDIFNLGGSFGIQGFEIDTHRDEQLLALGDFSLKVDTIQMAEANYKIDYLRLKEFYGIYEMYDDGSDNYSRLMLDTSSVENLDSTNSEEVDEIDYSNPFSVLAHYIQDIAHSYTESEYRFNEVSIANSSFDYIDYTPRDPFRYNITGFSVLADSLDSHNERLQMDFSSTLNQTGSFNGYLRSYTANLADIDLHYEIQGVELSPFSPYTSHYVDYPVLIGDMVYVSDTKIRNHIVESQNNLNFNQFDFGEKEGDGALYNLPVKLAVNLLKDLNGDIHLDIPIEGDLSDPEYKLSKVIWQTVSNIILKAVTAPFKMLANTFGMDEDKLKRLEFGLLQHEINESQEGQLKDLSKILANKEDINIEFKRVTKKYEELERYSMLKSISLFLGQDENLTVETITAKEKEALLEFDVKDEKFSEFVNSKIKEADWELPIQKRCILMIGEEKAIAATDKVGNERSESIRAYLIDERGLEAERLRFVVLPEDSLITHRSNSIYNVGFWIEE